MAGQSVVFSSEEFRKKMKQRGGADGSRCFQCATCSSVCNLTPDNTPFPRRQVLFAQWGFAEGLASDPAIWLCHQCNDCSDRCPRDAKPGDVMQAIRALMVEKLAFPGFMGKLVGNISVTWPLIIGLPILFWMVLLTLGTGFKIPVTESLAYHDFVPHKFIYLVYAPVFTYITIVMFIGGKKFWELIGQKQPRSGSFIQNLIPVLKEIVFHSRFDTCEIKSQKRIGHLLLFYGFVGAAVASGLIIVAIYVLGSTLPLGQANLIKIFGNVSALLLMVGGIMLLSNRLKQDKSAGATTPFDTFFIFIILLVTFTGVMAEVARLWLDVKTACGIYVVHLGSVLCLFITIPYSKFAHILYRTLSMVHERMANLK